MLDRSELLGEFDRARAELEDLAKALSLELEACDEVFRGSGGSADWKLWAESWGLVDAAGRARRIVEVVAMGTSWSSDPRDWWTARNEHDERMAVRFGRCRRCGCYKVPAVHPNDPPVCHDYRCGS